MIANRGGYSLLRALRTRLNEFNNSREAVYQEVTRLPSRPAERVVGSVGWLPPPGPSKLHPAAKTKRARSAASRLARVHAPAEISYTGISTYSLTRSRQKLK